MKTVVLNRFLRTSTITLLLFSGALSVSLASHKSKEKEAFPIYGDWQTFTTQDGLPNNKVYCVRVDGDRVWVGTKHGLALYENGEWKTFTTDDGLAHSGVLAIDVSELTSDVWIGTMGGLNRYSAGKFETFNQFNSGMPNDVVYAVACHGKDVWIELKQLEGDSFDLKGYFFHPDFLASKTLRIKFVSLIKILLEQEGASIEAFTIKELSKRFCISESILQRVRKELREG